MNETMKQPKHKNSKKGKKKKQRNLQNQQQKRRKTSKKIRLTPFMNLLLDNKTAFASNINNNITKQ